MFVENVWKSVQLLALPLLGAAVGCTSVGAADAPGWEIEIYATGLPGADNIVLAEDGGLYVSLELPDGRGEVLRLHSGKRVSIARGLNRADGLVLGANKLYVTEEVAAGRILEIALAGNTVTERARLRNPEGIDLLPDGSLVISEDITGGRVVHLAADGDVTTIVASLARPEGLAVNAAGDIFVAETSTGRILKISGWQSGPARVSTLLDSLDEPDQIEISEDGALWIAEDANPGRLVKYAGGKLIVIASGLNRPQGIALGPEGVIYLAEQGESRILKLKQK